MGFYFLLQGIFLTQGSNLRLLAPPALAGGFFITVPPGKPKNTGVGSLSLELPDPGIEPWCPALQVDSLPAELPGKHIAYSI